MSPRRDDDDDYDDRKGDYDDEYEDERPSRRGSRRGKAQQPGKAQAIAIMTLIGGIVACLNSGLWLVNISIWGIGSFGIGFLCCLWPGPYYGITVGVLAIIKGAQLLGKDARSHAPPRGISIMMIINIINGDVINCVLGILNLVFCTDPEVENWYRGG